MDNICLTHYEYYTLSLSHTVNYSMSISKWNVSQQMAKFTLSISDTKTWEKEAEEIETFFEEHFAMWWVWGLPLE